MPPRPGPPRACPDCGELHRRHVDRCDGCAPRIEVRQPRACRAPDVALARMAAGTWTLRRVAERYYDGDMQAAYDDLYGG